MVVESVPAIMLADTTGQNEKAGTLAVAPGNSW
jgi:hypothetical protein